MTYFLVTFTPVTGPAFLGSSRTDTGFKEQPRRWENVRQGDTFICYLTRPFSRWFGALKVESGPCRDSSPICGSGLPLFTDHHDSDTPAPDLYQIRFEVKPCVVLDNLEHAVPIYKPEVWDKLSFTRGQERTDPSWKAHLRGNLKEIRNSDGSHLVELLEKQLSDPKCYPLSSAERRELDHAESKKQQHYCPDDDD